MTKLDTSRWQLAGAHSSTGTSAPAAFRVSRTRAFADTPVSQQVLTWLIFWPLLSLIARQAVYFTGPARSAGFYQNGAAAAGGPGSHYYLYVNLVFLFGFVIAGHRQILAVLKKNMLIIAMLALGVCSAMWSASPKITLQMCIEVGLCTFFACFLATRYTTERLMQLLIFMGAIAGLLSVFFALALPNYGLFQGYAGHAWQGICNHKNTLGISMAFLLSPALFSQSYGRRRRLAYGVLLLFLIYMSQSRGAWFDTIGMLLFVGWVSLIRRVRGRELKLLLFLTASAGVVILALVVHFWPILAVLIGKDPSMTGRSGIYIEVWRSVIKHPLLGYGFGGFWFPGSLESQRVGLALRWPNIGYSENGFLELALQIGFIGVGLLVAMLAKAVVQGIRLLRSPQYSPRVGWFLTILFLAALTNIDAGWFMTADTLDWPLIVVACVGLNEEMSRSHTGREYSQPGAHSPLIQTCPS